MEEEPSNPFTVILIGVIFDPAKRKILIAKKGEIDKDLPKLTWHFPGGRLLHGEDIDKKLKSRIKERTGYEVKNLGSIFSKTYPEEKEVLAVYFLCEVFGGEQKSGQGISELKWVNPEELEKHFTTSFHPRLKEYIINLK